MSLPFPGNCATPRETAQWCKSVAEGEFGLPGILPVMTSAVELTSAWTSEGCLDDIPGYNYSVDHDSLNLWQQRPSQGWGTVAQLMDPEYALRAFCREAKRIEDDSPADTPQQLGAWCQAVQRSAYPERYAERGYPIAKALLEQTEYPQRKIGFDSSGWALDIETGVYLKSDRTDARLYTNTDGWLWGDPPKTPVKQWEWPVANDSPTTGGYVARHPTRYTWRADVETIARTIVDGWPGAAWCNTYYDHPEGYWRTFSSFDVWDYSAGRGGWLDDAAGGEIFDWLWNLTWGPDIEWIIYRGWIYGAWNGWAGEPFGDGSTFMNHDDHIHVTYVGAG